MRWKITNHEVLHFFFKVPWKQLQNGSIFCTITGLLIQSVLFSTLQVFTDLNGKKKLRLQNLKNTIIIYVQTSSPTVAIRHFMSVLITSP